MAQRAGMKNRSHPLRVWLASRDKTLTEFAAELGVSLSYLSDVVIGKRNPSPAYVEMLRRATKGAVTEEDF